MSRSHLARRLDAVRERDATDRIPASWSRMPLKYLCGFNDDVLPETTDPDTVIRYVDIGGVSASEGIKAVTPMRFGDAPSRARRLVCHGDVIVSTVRTYLEAVAPIQDPPDDLVVSTGFAVIRPRDGLLPEFAKYALRSREFVGEVAARSVGVSYPAINASDLVRISVPLPPAEDQVAIARFLDHETACIDALVAKHRSLIGLLQEKRDVATWQAVTRGVRPAPMRDVRREWIGSVPHHWDLARIRHVAKLESGHTPSRQHPEYWEDCYIPWVTLSDVSPLRSGREMYVRDTLEKVSDLGIANSAARVLPAGTVILSRTASVGFSAILASPMATTQDFANWVCGDRVLPEYLYFVLQAMKPEYRRLMMGSTHQTIYMPDIAELEMPLPPMEEQREIVEYLLARRAEIDATQDKARELIALLQERRSAVITAAVTGQIDVREWHGEGGLSRQAVMGG